jgi:hypothetical protein
MVLLATAGTFWAHNQAPPDPLLTMLCEGGPSHLGPSRVLDDGAALLPSPLFHITIW